MNDEGSPSTKYRPIEDQGAGFPAGTGERRASASPRVLTSWHIAFFTSLTMLVAVSAFAVGLIVERRVFRNASPLSVVTGDTPYDQVAEMARLLQNEYYFRPVTEEEREAFSQELEYAAVDGMTSTLDDPYTTFLPPVEAGPAADHLEGEFGGIGVHIQYIDGRLTVVAPIADSPADRAGIEPGDVIVEADGVTLSELTPAKAGALIRGPVGSTVELLIERSSALEPVEMEIVREEIETQVVYYDLVPETSIAHLRVTSFTERTIPQLDAALEQALTDGVTGIVLDLRDNGGGLVAAAQALIGRFVPSEAGPALWEDRGAGSGALVSLPIAGGEIEAYELPLIVVVNEGTASAAEIVAGALRDYGRAPLIGEPTFGKGLVQRIWNFDDGSSARITVARWLTPDKSAIPEDGLRVNIAVPLVPSVIDDDPIALRAARALQTEGWSEVRPNW